ncbi:MAG: type II toxin-antitoxin system HicB family antitoxin [Chloroflexi bacterium]|nr:type II toxin-antitoxin system HicB family antitoxin [Chloroflexota bacterium]
MNDNWRKAEELAARPYHIDYFGERDEDGKHYCYAKVREMPGCHSDGATIDEARENVQSALVDFIYFLLEDELAVPEPQPLGERVIVNLRERDYFPQMYPATEARTAS